MLPPKSFALTASNPIVPPFSLLFHMYVKARLWKLFIGEYWWENTSKSKLSTFSVQRFVQASITVLAERSIIHSSSCSFCNFIWRSHWLDVSSHWKWWQQSVQQHRLLVLFTSIFDVHGTNANSSYMCVCLLQAKHLMLLLIFVLQASSDSSVNVCVASFRWRLQGSLLNCCDASINISNGYSHLTFSLQFL